MPDDHTHAPKLPERTQDEIDRDMAEIRQAIAAVQEGPKRLPVWPEDARCETCAAWLPPTPPFARIGRCGRLTESTSPVLVSSDAPANVTVFTPKDFACNQWKEKP